MEECCDVAAPAAHLEGEHDDVQQAADEGDGQCDERHDTPDDERDGVAGDGAHDDEVGVGWCGKWEVNRWRVLCALPRGRCVVDAWVVSERVSEWVWLLPL